MVSFSSHVFGRLYSLAGVYAINAYLTGLMQNYMGYTAFQTGLTQTNHYEDYLNAHIVTVKMLEAAATGLHKALVEAGPFSDHAVDFSDRLTNAPFAHDLQQVVLHAYDKGMSGDYRCNYSLYWCNWCRALYA
ncbi:hypothetical protein [Weissella cibaria]|uniref:hypothetical protein n=1 Tax=Weissella cibaria TaxID=137591 RepID=UPI001FD69C78|nr:hypothetical protein [Weissella cibaria]